MQIYYGVTIDKEASIEIAGRSRGTPRIANRLLKRVADYATVLNNSNISKEISVPSSPSGRTFSSLIWVKIAE